MGHKKAFYALMGIKSGCWELLYKEGTVCFSATVSFSVAAALHPAGISCARTANEIDPKWVPLAIYPLAFSIQQMIEGVLWLGIYTDYQIIIAGAARGFLFISHFFWLAWVPFFCIFT